MGGAVVMRASRNGRGLEPRKGLPGGGRPEGWAGPEHFRGGLGRGGGVVRGRWGSGCAGWWEPRAEALRLDIWWGSLRGALCCGVGRHSGR